VGDHRASPLFTERERVALEYAERFVGDHESIDDALVARLRAAFDDGEVLELSACIARHMGFSRITRVLRLDHDHCPLPDPHGESGAGELGTRSR
jgi:alkylhydroperoxidase family enzyme